MAMALGEKIKQKVEYITKPPGCPTDRSLERNQLVVSDKLAAATQAARARLNLTDSLLHVAVVGAKGAGKTSLIKGLLNLPSEDDADDRYPRPYKSDALPGAMLWEMAGAGVGHPALTYFVDKELYAFDYILIVNDRFQKVDLEVARLALQAGKRFCFVRTKADVALSRLLERERGRVHSINEAMKMLRNEVEASFREALRLASMADKWEQLKMYVLSTREYFDAHVYSNLQTKLHHIPVEGQEKEKEEEEDVEEDEGKLPCMDEALLLNFLRDTIRFRVRRTLSRARSAVVRRPNAPQIN